MKTSELTGANLDWAVAKALGLTATTIYGLGSVRAPGWYQIKQGRAVSYVLRPTYNKWVKQCETHPWQRGQEVWEPSVNWKQGGPLIEQEHISIEVDWDRRQTPPELRFACCTINQKAKGEWHKSPAPLVAAMRSYVAEKLGNFFEVPEIQL